MNDIYISFGTQDTPKAYQKDVINALFEHILTFIDDKVAQGLKLPYYPFGDDFTLQDWQGIAKTLDIYICDKTEGQELNLNARGKDYATNILSYPSELPADLLTMMDSLPLGELIICHDVVVHEANEQGKTLNDHLTHLLVHGILHLLGFDHELGQDQQDEMEGLEIEILAGFGVSNPYE